MSLTLADASTDNVNFGDPVAMQDVQEGTLIIDIHPTSVGNSTKLVAGKITSGNGWFLSKDATDGTKLRLQINRATADLIDLSITGVLAVNTWYCVAGVWSVSGSTAAIYAGGPGAAMTDVSAAPTGGSGAYVTDVGSSFLAGNANGGSAGWPGRLGCMAFFGAVLTLAQCTSWNRLPRRQVAGITALGFWRLGNEGTGAQQDYSGNGNTGTVTGATQALNGPPRGQYGYRHGLYVPHHLLAA